MTSGVITTIFNTLIMLISYPVYLHYLGYEKMGVWMILSTVLTIMRLSDLGIGPAVTKLVAEEYGRGNKQGIQAYVTTALLTVLVTGCIAFIFLIILAKPIIGVFRLGTENSSVALRYLPYMGILTVYAFFVQILTATLSGLGRMDQSNYRDAICRGISVLVAIMFLFLGKGMLSLLIGMAVSYVLMHFISVILIREIVNIPILKFNWDYERFKKLVGFGGAVFGSSIINMLINPFNKLMLSRYAGIATVPVFEIAFNSSMQVRGLIESAFRALVPEISRIGSNITLQARERIYHIYKRSMRLIFIFSVPVYIIVMLLAPILLRIWLGDRFVETMPGVFRIMLAGVSFLSLIGVPAYYTIMGVGKIRYIIISSSVGAFCNLISVVICFLLMGHISLYSIGMCLSLSYIIPLLYLVFVTQHFFTYNLNISEKVYQL